MSHKGGRPKDPIWDSFIITAGKAQCNNCLTLVSKKADRMKSHLIKCLKAPSVPPSSQSPDVIVVSTSAGEKRPACEDDAAPPPKRQKPDNTQPSVSKLFVRTTHDHKQKLDEKCAELIYAANLPFSLVEHPAFRSFVSALRPGYTPPAAKTISSKLLDQTHEKLQDTMKQTLTGKTVTVQQDGWSDIHNRPVVASCLNVQGKPYLLEAEDSKHNTKNAECYREKVVQSIDKAENQYGCKVSSCVTDSAKNMVNMRAALEKERPDIITYPCGAHNMNLLGQDITPKSVVKHVVEVNKYFRNHHKPSSLLHDMPGSVAPQLPGDTRWNSQRNSVASYIKNRPNMISVVQNHPEEFDQHIINKIMDLNLFRKAKDLLDQLKPVAIGLNKVQADDATIADSCDIYLKLMEEDALKPHAAAVEKRFKEAIQSVHFAAHLLHPVYQGRGQSDEQKESAKAWVTARDPTFLILTMAFQVKSAPFHLPSFFLPEVLGDEATKSKGVNTITWWKALAASVSLPPKFLDLMLQLHDASASSASMERIFSRFGLTQTKLRNKLCTDKLQKLAFCHQMLRDPDYDV